MVQGFGKLLERCIETPKKANIWHFLRRVKEPREQVANFIAWVEEAAALDPRDAFPLCKLAVRLATAVDSRCLRFRAFNVLACTHQLLSRHEQAQRAFSVAYAHSEECDLCLAVVQRAHARFLATGEQHEEALTAYHVAVESSRSQQDLQGEGRALVGRAHVYSCLEDYPKAIEDVERALSLLSPMASLFHSVALKNLTVYLAHGTQDDALRALEMMPEVEAAFEGIRDHTLERAKLKWVKGLLAIRVGYQGKGVQHLRSARNMLIRLGLPDEVAAITADLAVANHPERQAIRDLFRETLRLELAWGDLYGHLDAVWRSTSTENPFLVDDPDGEIMESIKDLREAIDVDGIPRQFLGFLLLEPDGEPIGF